MEKIPHTHNCMFCSKPTTVYLSEEEYVNYFYKGMLLQDAMPHAPACIREICKTGMCMECQKEYFFQQEVPQEIMDSYLNPPTAPDRAA